VTIAGVPEGARPAARVLLLDARDRLLLLEAEEKATGHRFWITPGGGLRPGENFADAARREVREETGLDCHIGPWVWTRRHRGIWNAERPFDAYERFFVAITNRNRIKPRARDDYVIGHRWWTVDAIRDSSNEFAPRLLGEYLIDIVNRKYPRAPIDCGS
jgi:8-oxo-dGTP pyrophosphatase MutT (NUDIX family)